MEEMRKSGCLIWWNPLPVGSYAWHYQYDDKLFSGIRESNKITYHYSAEKCRVIHSESNYFELHLEIKWSDCGAGEICRCYDPPQAENPALQDSFLHNRKLRHSVVENQQELQSNSWGVGPAANSFLCTAPCRGNNPLCGTRGAQRVGEDESSLLDYTVPRRGNKPPFHHAKIICPIIFPAVQAYKSIGQSTSKGWNPQVCVCAASTNL